MKKTVVAWGRMNPPTIGHQKLVERVIAIAKREQADPGIYLSHTQSAKDGASLCSRRSMGGGGSRQSRIWPLAAEWRRELGECFAISEKLE